MNTRSKDLEEEMWDSAEILACAVEAAMATPADVQGDEAISVVNKVFKASKTFTERYRAYVEDLTRLT